MSDSSLATVDCVLEDVLETERVITEFGEVKVAAITSVRIKQPYLCVVSKKFTTPYYIYEHIYLTIAPVSSAHDVIRQVDAVLAHRFKSRHPRSVHDVMR